MLPPPERSFASDNTAGIAGPVLDAIVAANDGAAVAYGADPFTERFTAQIHDLFGPEATPLLTWGGTGANIVALASLVQPYQAVICPASSHIAVDECGGPERFLGSKLIDVATTDGKLRPADVEEQLGVLGVVHHAQPGAISITQVTETGQVYSLDELADLCAVAKGAGLRVHMDGARIANAAAALDLPVKHFTADIGVDVLSFGATKNGIAYGEAVVLFDPSLVEAARFHQKQAAQLPSKMRFVAAQLSALLENDLWLEHGRQANAMAQLLAKGAADIPGIEITQAVQANAVFAKLPRAVVQRLQAWTWFYVWQAAPAGEADPVDEVRWMTSFATTSDDVQRFLDGVAHEMTNG